MIDGSNDRNDDDDDEDDNSTFSDALCSPQVVNCSPEITTKYSCGYCTRSFDTQRGRNIHVSKVHPDVRSQLSQRCHDEVSQVNINVDTITDIIPAQTQEASDSVQNDNLGESAVCPHCKMTFKNSRGVRTHIGCAHVEQANEKNAETIRKKDKHPKTNEAERGIIENEKRKVEEKYNDWLAKFKALLSDGCSNETFDHVLQGFMKFLCEANESLPGPKHPAVKFYRLRKKKKNNMSINNARYTQTSNPQRRDKKARQKRRDAYDFELAQYNYYNMRKKVVRKIMDENIGKSCNIEMNKIEDYFRSQFECENEKTLEHYPTSHSTGELNLVITIEDVIQAIKSTSYDTSPGPDRVLVRTLKELKAAEIIQIIAQIMMKTAYCPRPFREGRTILIHKGKDETEVKNWRPVTIYSILRRVIEKVLDRKLRDELTLNSNQRGFVNGVQGCHINTKIMNACLKDAKLRRKTCVVTFLDVTQAFSNIGHSHIKRCLEAAGVSNDLKNVIISLLVNNHFKIECSKKYSKPIRILCGVSQGSPLSPILFNLAINFLYEELCDPGYAQHHGYELEKDLDPVSLAGFADDIAVSSNSIDSAIHSVNLIQSLLEKIGLKINPSKSASIALIQGVLWNGTLTVLNGDSIKTILKDEKIKYLGCTFNEEIMFDYDVVDVFTKNCNKLVTSPLLKPDQKLNVINQYMFPTLVYTLQVVPLEKMPDSLLENLNIIIRRSVKAIVGIPAHTVNSMLYAPRKLRGLAIINCHWEAYLQHFTIAKKLENINDQLLHCSFNAVEEISLCVEKLNVIGDTTKFLRQQLRDNSYQDWCSANYQGIGVIHFQQFTQSNSFILDKNTLSSSEWTAAIKMNVGYANLAGVQSTGSASNLCRRCNREKETLPHVLGACPYNEQMVTSRHHVVKRRLIELLKEKNFECFEEVGCVDSHGSRRFCDIVAFPRNSKKAYILDPTVRFESNDKDQDEKIDREKKEIYEGCISYLREKYSQDFPNRDYEVLGLWFGSRGTIGKGVITLFEKLSLSKTHLKTISERIIKNSIQIINHHIHG